MREVKYLTIVLEFFSEYLAETPQYKNALWCLLRLCQKPPLLTTRSEILGAEEILADYFTGLGNCLIIVEDPEIKTLIIEVLHNLLGKRDQEDVPFDVCVKALVKSKIGDKLAKLIYVIDEEFYPEILDLILKYAIMSKDCGKWIE
ncbi:hypothetical protein GE061_017627 [Apolygus lucorum]|uniref:Uncharacterized protein n=1 Tax=Apolygus lucorum TaxID=248454 RepID=A0A8S9XCX7_APOLU|nr:hypothetical protein GE061_017627 [Apolygus lucorum]